MPIAAVVDVSLVVLGGGIGVNGDLLLGPVRSELERWLPYPPQVEISSLGETAVLTGALYVGSPRRSRTSSSNRLRTAPPGSAASEVEAPAHEQRSGLPADLDEPEVLVERDPVRVRLVHARGGRRGRRAPEGRRAAAR